MPYNIIERGAIWVDLSNLFGAQATTSIGNLVDLLLHNIHIAAIKVHHGATWCGGQLV